MGIGQERQQAAGWVERYVPLECTAQENYENLDHSTGLVMRVVEKNFELVCDTYTNPKLETLPTHHFVFMLFA